jgi:hypothetical protein
MYLELPADSRQLYAPHCQQWADAPALHFHSTGWYQYDFKNNLSSSSYLIPLSRVGKTYFTDRLPDVNPP